MKAFLKRFIGANRRPVIAVIGMTRQDVIAGIAHAQTSESGLPIWAWSADAASGSSLELCERFSWGASASQVHKDLRSVWPALIIVSWTGERRALLLKLIAFTVPPFRIVISNEAGGFFAAKPLPVAEHARRRFRDASLSGARRLSDLAAGISKALWTGLVQTASKLWSLLLALLSLFAKVTPPLTRAMMRRMQKGSHSPVFIPDECGSRFTEIVVSGRSWSRRNILAAVHSSNADFIVFRRLGETGDAEPLIALARATNAFAVGRQMAFAGWRKTIVTRHPFRKLQPDEVTQVLAPWSPLLVIRRDLILHFGIPQALTFGGALLILCWKAAAAGLQSLIMGQSGPVTQEPGMELEDADFAFHLALLRPLQALAPTHPARVRGNVVSAPGSRSNFRPGFPRVLVVSPYLPFPLSHGGAVRIYNLCRAMSGEVDFVLACFREADETVRYRELHEVFREVHVVDIDEKSVDASVPKQVAEYRNSAMAELVRSICVPGEVNVLQLEYTQMAEYAAHSGGVPVILVEHDLTFTLHEQLANTLGTPAAKIQYELWLAFERAALQRANVVWTMSDLDRKLAFEHGAPGTRTFVVPNGVDLQRFQPVRRQTDERAILFVGSFRHLPNLLAFEVLRTSIMPLIWVVFPDVKLNVIAGTHQIRPGAADPRIRIQGFVEDVRPAYRECDIAVIPLPVSAGTNIKLMEAMACGRAVVSTPVGCQGLGLQDGSDVLIRNAERDFAAAVIRLLQDEPLRLKISAKARQTAEARFGWEAIAACAFQTYVSIWPKACFPSELGPPLATCSPTL